MLRKNVASQYIYFVLVNATTGAALTGATVTVRRALDNAAQANATGTTTELGNGHYRFNLSQADTNADYVGLLFTATNAIPVSWSGITTGGNFADAVRFGLTALPNAAAEAAGGLYTRGTGAGQINQPANGRVDTNVVAVAGTTQTARDLGANLDAAVTTRATPAQVNAEVLDVLTVDTFAEPGQAAPPATTTLADKLAYLFKAWRNRSTQTSSQYSLYADNTTTVDQKASFSDNGSTADRGEVASGP